MLKERNFVRQVVNSREHAACQQAGPSQQRAVSLVVANWHFVVTFRLAAGQVACLRLLPDLSQAGSTSLSTSCFPSQMVWEALELCWGSREPGFGSGSGQGRRPLSGVSLHRVLVPACGCLSQQDALSRARGRPACALMRQCHLACVRVWPAQNSWSGTCLCFLAI